MNLKTILSYYGRNIGDIMTKIDRYQGWINCSNGAINDHQKNECVVKFNHIPKDKKDKLLNACLNILNLEEDDVE